MAYSPPPPPLVTTSIKARVNAIAVENQRSAIPFLALPLVLPFLLPYWGVRWVYRKATGYQAPVFADPSVPDAAELAAAMDEICTGSGRDAGSDGQCAVCGNKVEASGGQVMTHQP